MIGTIPVIFITPEACTYADCQMGIQNKSLMKMPLAFVGVSIERRQTAKIGIAKLSGRID